MTRPLYAVGDADRDYANGAFIAGATAYPPRWAAAASAFRDTLGGRAALGIAYGAGQRQLLDRFVPDQPARGTVIFVHGGYWMDFDRLQWSHLAAGPLARGFSVVMPSYTLAPAARIGSMTDEIATVCRLVGSWETGPIIVTGHSAGGHLAARMGCADQAVPVARVVPIAPLAELAPLRATGMNEILRIDATESAKESPARHGLRSGVSAHVWVGANERPAFLWQARLLAEEWDCGWTAAEGKHHFNVIDDLADPGSALCDALVSGF